MASFLIAMGDTLPDYTEGSCLDSSHAQVGLEACGFYLQKPDHYEWDIIDQECRKIDVFISKIDSDWIYRQIRQHEVHSLKDCGYDLQSAQAKFYMDPETQLCRKSMTLSSSYGLEDHTYLAAGAVDKNLCFPSIEKSKNEVQRSLASREPLTNRPTLKKENRVSQRGTGDLKKRRR